MNRAQRSDVTVAAAVARHSAEVERAVVACILLEPSRLDGVLAQVDEGDFAAVRERAVFSAMVRVRRAGLPIDLVTLQEDLERKGQLEAAGGPAALASLDLELPDVGRCDAYCRVVRRDSLARQAARVLARSLERLRTCEAPAEIREDLAEAHRLLDSTVEVGAGSVTLLEMLPPAIARYKAIRAGQRQVGITTGFPSLDRGMVALASRDLMVIAGYAGQGKTTFAEQLLFNFARRGHRPLFVSLEMGREQEEDRSVARLVRSPLRFVREGRFRIEDLEAWAAAEGNGDAAARLRFAFPRTNRLDEVVDLVRATHRRHPLDVVMVDHLHRVRVPGLERRMEVDAVARALKQLAVEMEVPVVAPCQINRASMSGGNRPRLWHLAESGAIEQEADIVFTLERPEENGPLEVRLEKARQGEAGAKATLVFDETSRSLRELDERYGAGAPAPSARSQEDDPW